MGVLCPPPPPPFYERERKVPLSLADPATMLLWVKDDSGRTLWEFAHYEWTNHPAAPPPPPPSRPLPVKTPFPQIEFL